MVSGIYGDPRDVSYEIPLLTRDFRSASKHGIIGLTRTAAKENGHREVRVNAVAPGAIFTPLMEKAWKLHNYTPATLIRGTPPEPEAAFERQGTSEEVGHVIAFLLGPDSKYVTGTVQSVDGGM